MNETTKIEVNTEKLTPFINGLKETIDDFKSVLKRLEGYGVIINYTVDDTEAHEKVKDFVEIKVINA